MSVPQIPVPKNDTGKDVAEFCGFHHWLMAPVEVQNISFRIQNLGVQVL